MPLNEREGKVVEEILGRGEYVCVPDWKGDMAILDGEFNAEELRVLAGILERGEKCQS